MLFALTSCGERIGTCKAQRGGVYMCPGCKGRVVFKCGMIIIHHFSHYRLSDCESEPMTKWHIDWQRKFEDICIEIRIGKHIADVLGYFSKRVLEVQHSQITLEKALERVKEYGNNMVWIFDGEKFSSKSKTLDKLSKVCYVFRDYGKGVEEIGHRYDVESWVPYYMMSYNEFLLKFFDKRELRITPELESYLHRRAVDRWHLLLCKYMKRRRSIMKHKQGAVNCVNKRIQSREDLRRRWHSLFEKYTIVAHKRKTNISKYKQKAIECINDRIQTRKGQIIKDLNNARRRVYKKWYALVARVIELMQVRKTNISKYKRKCIKCINDRIQARKEKSVKDQEIAYKQTEEYAKKLKEMKTRGLGVLWLTDFDSVKRYKLAGLDYTSK